MLARLLGGVLAPRVHVASTSIFARRLDERQQGLVYSLELSVAGEVAMILPLPVQPGLGDDALTFVDLERHPGFFGDLLQLFYPPETTRSLPKSRSLLALSLPTLKVHEVGAFEASFVPSPQDFGRLDPRFRLRPGLWDELGGYDDWGFAVFRLKPGKKKQIHPMALRFASRQPSRLFFPTVHVHDGRVHESAHFDHALYYQGEALATGDVASILTPGRDYEGLVEQGKPVHRRCCGAGCRTAIRG